jgi:hypothetical protein
MTVEPESELTCEQVNELLREKIKELEEALRKEIEFKVASTIPKQSIIWVAAKNMLSLVESERKAIALCKAEPLFDNESQQNRHIILDYEPSTGEIKGAYVER